MLNTEITILKRVDSSEICLHKVSVRIMQQTWTGRSTLPLNVG